MVSTKKSGKEDLCMTAHIIHEKVYITEEMRYRERLCLYALSHGVTKAARRYHTNRQFVYRQLEKYDGTVRSSALKSRRPHGHKHQHTDEELALIRRMFRRNGKYGHAETYVRCRAHGYTRSFGSMCRQIRQQSFHACVPCKRLSTAKNTPVFTLAKLESRTLPSRR